LTDVGFAVSETVGGGEPTATDADWLAWPPQPVQLRVKVLFAVSPGLIWLPEGALLPVHAPEALQVSVLVEDQVRVVTPS
jgi:hypothetical protein